MEPFATQPSRHSTPQRGFTLLIAILLASVALVIGLALADVAYKQVVLSSTARNSQIAFYRADSALECALYYDQQFAFFNDKVGTSLSCEGVTIPTTKTDLADGGVKTTFTIPCPAGGRSASVAVYKQVSSFCSTVGIQGRNCLYASGFNTCSVTDPNRFERALKAVY
ncbi:MAG TPA: hypothetical protein VGB97_04815 [Candidatus Paceibacterota bacterium]|jgi:Tfp pilus assembly protein PilE